MLVGTGIVDEQKVRPEVADQSAQGLATLQVVVEKDRPVGAQLVDVRGQPALSGVALAVLLALFPGQLWPVRRRIPLWLHKHRHQWQHALVAVGHDRGREHRMEVLHGAVLADMAGGALGAVNRVRAVDLEAVQSDQQATAEALERGQGPVLAERVEADREQLSEAVGAQPVEQIAKRLSQGMAWTLKSVWQLEREVSCCIRRWNWRNKRVWKKKTARAQAAASERA